MIEATRIGFEPWFGWPFLWTAIAITALAWIAYLVLRGRAWLSRGLALSVLSLALANPSIIEEERAPLPSVAALVLDRSESMTFADRTALSEAVFTELQSRIAPLETIELRVLETDRRADRTELVTALDALMADVPRDRIAGAILVTDGQVHDIPDNLTSLSALGPVHAIVTGEDDSRDRSLAIISAPAFDIVGETADVVIRAEDSGAERLTISASLNGEPLGEFLVPTAEDYTLPVQIDRRGPNVLVIETEGVENELTLANNRTATTINGVRDRLRVLLITGEPHPGARVWRDLLKSDPQVDLVHFTILRPPTKTDNVPEEELALIGFPTEQLFEEKLKDFDLIIFDQYERRGVILFSYLANMARYVDEGGALLVIAGSDFAGPASLYNSALAGVLPIRPTGRVIESRYVPQRSEIGRRHTVTEPLRGTNWGPWYRYIEGEASAGETLLTTPGGGPLLALDRVGEGRVGQLMTDQIWLWSRGHEGGGPFAELIRRTIHWLMGEPELEERKLEMVASSDGVDISLFILESTPPALTVETPQGKTLTPRWQRDANGVFRTRIENEGLGLYRARAGDLEAVTLNGPANPEEYEDLTVSAEPVTPLVEDTSGGIIRVKSATDVPDVRSVGERGRASGSDWIGLRERRAYAVTSSRSRSLLPGWLGMALVVGLLMLAWRREGR